MVNELKFNLQLFADGAAASVGATGTGATGDGNVNASSGETALQTDDVKGADKGEGGKEMSFDELLKSNKDYEKEYKKRMDKAIKDRLKSSKEESEKFAQIRRNMAANYDLDIDDLDGMVAKSEEWRKEAIRRKSLETGDSEAIIAENEKNAFEAKTYKEQLEAIKRQNEANEFDVRISREMEIAKEHFPDIKFEDEIENPLFRNLIKSNWPVLSAYKAVHHDDIVTGAVADAVKVAEEKFANSVASGVNRPNENGTKNTSPAITRTSPRDYTAAQRAEIKERVRRGERVTLDTF